MKTKNSFWGIIGLSLIGALLFTSCQKEVIVEKTTKIVGTVKLKAGTLGDISNAQVALYLSDNDWANYNPVRIADVSGTTSKISFSFTDVVPGNYLLDAWVDCDQTGSWTSGDIVGWYGSGALGNEYLSPFMVAEGKTVTINVEMIVIP
ncbi:MAG: hypothetical protein V2A67_05245 [Bacteroidota bacterium]